jgi:hypothetical protein
LRIRGNVALLVVGGALVTAPAASAATLAVDDDRKQCPSAGYTAVQAAIDAAAPGDTVAICPGTYAEGTGAAGTNALTISKPLTLRGAGADLVRVSPPRTNAAGGQIAEASPDIANGVGDILAVVGTPAAPITVNVSGITFDGNGVYVEAGIVFADAQGSVSRSRVTNVVTTEAAGGYLTPGGWRDAYPGYGIAHVSADPGASAPRALAITSTRIDRYNAAGVWIDGASADGSVDTSEVVGRVLCQNFEANGNCSNPGVVTTGPLFGQDGVHATGLAAATVTNSIVTQNVTNGTGAPIRNSATNNDNLDEAAGIRLAGADVAGSLITRNNIVDNGYGVINVDGGGAASAAPVAAEQNWWGLRLQPATPNTGPAVSPLTNPPFPENPVNGVADVTLGSTAVDFMPFRSGPQSDPLTGQYPNIQAPLPADDAAPTVALSADRTAVNRGDAVTLTATAADDFGIKKVTFSDGATTLGTDTAPPYTATLAIAADAPCAARTLTATAQDSLGQTNAATTTVTVVGPNNCEPPVAAPTVSLPDTVNAIAQGGTDVDVGAGAAAGVAKVELFLGGRLICAMTTAPYTCRVVPKPADVGLQSLRAVVTDAKGQTAVATRQVQIDRFRSRGVSIAVHERKRKRNRETRTITATVRPPAGTTPAEVCGEGSVTFVIERKGRTLINKQVRLRKDCTSRIAFTAKRTGKKIHAVSARFGGNTVLQPASSTRRFS